MKKACVLLILCSSLALGFASSGPIEVHSYGSLKAVTINVWSGSDYQGVRSFGYWETPEILEQRYQGLVEELRGLRPDVVFLQEVNPVRKYSRRLAKDLAMDEIHQVCIAGLKVFGLGIPKGFMEGNAILARPELRLQKVDDWKLSGSPGIYSDNFTFHTDETVSALVGQIVYDAKPLNLVCVHLSAYPERDPALQDSLRALGMRDGLSAETLADFDRKWSAGLERREKETRRLLKRIKGLDQQTPLIMGGDFNATPGSPVMARITEEGGFTDSAEGMPEYYTWDAVNNSNTWHSALRTDARGKPDTPWENFSSAAASLSRRLDYILLDKFWNASDVMDNHPAFTDPEDSLYVSDHYGVLTDLDMKRFLAEAPKQFDTIPRSKTIVLSGFPILMYDTDTGFGYGAKGYLRNAFQRNESFDLILFNSTKGERWYKLEFSLPDKELRQRRKYPLALDLKIDYDKWINSKYYPSDYDSATDEPEEYQKEPFEVLLMLTHPFNRYLNGQIGLRFKHVSMYGYPEGGDLAGELEEEYHNEAAYLSNILNLRLDTRDSVNNPSRGYVLQYELESNYLQNSIQNALDWDSFEWDREKSLQFSWGTGFDFLRQTLNAQYYTVLFYPRTVLALRVQGASQTIVEDDPIPLPAMLPLGGGTTLRGSPTDRYLGNTVAIGNAEVRFPIWKGFGGVLGYDFGEAVSNRGKLRWDKIVSNPVVGLRYYLADFVVRADIGFGKETTGFYFNFGHAF